MDRDFLVGRYSSTEWTAVAKRRTWLYIVINSTRFAERAMMTVIPCVMSLVKKRANRRLAAVKVRVGIQGSDMLAALYRYATSLELDPRLDSSTGACLVLPTQLMLTAVSVRCSTQRFKLQLLVGKCKPYAHRWMTKTINGIHEDAIQTANGCSANLVDTSCFFYEQV